MGDAEKGKAGGGAGLRPNSTPGNQRPSSESGEGSLERMRHQLETAKQEAGKRLKAVEVQRLRTWSSSST